MVQERGSTASYVTGQQGTPDHNLYISLYANIPVLKSLSYSAFHLRPNSRATLICEGRKFYILPVQENLCDLSLLFLRIRDFNIFILHLYNSDTPMCACNNSYKYFFHHIFISLSPRPPSHPKDLNHQPPAALTPLFIKGLDRQFQSFVTTWRMASGLGAKSPKLRGRAGPRPSAPAQDLQKLHQYLG